MRNDSWNHLPIPPDLSRPREQTKLIRQDRGPRNQIVRDRPVATFTEQEVRGAGQSVSTTVVIIGGAECRFTCAMCDLWQNTIPSATPPGAVPAQIRHAVKAVSDSDLSGPAGSSARWIKLYNGSNFFDPRAVPPTDLPSIADLVSPFERVIVENHPRLTTAAIPDFRDRCSGRLELAMGLECVHPDILPRLNKQMSLADFASACRRLHSWGIDTRAFVLFGLPWLSPREAVNWCLRSVHFAWEQGVRHVSVVPTRLGNGFLDRLRDEGLFVEPTAVAVEAVADAVFTVIDHTARTPAGDPQLVTVDLWDWPRLTGHCNACRDQRYARLAAMNRYQSPLPSDQLSCGCLP